jgi:hypothetical protein
MSLTSSPVVKGAQVLVELMKRAETRFALGSGERRRSGRTVRGTMH